MAMELAKCFSHPIDRPAYTVGSLEVSFDGYKMVTSLTNIQPRHFEKSDVSREPPIFDS
jgi:hypothetical protein